MFKKFGISIIFLLITACESEVISVHDNPNFTARDMNIYTDITDIDPLQYEQLIDDLYLQIEKMGYSTTKLRQKAKVVDIYIADHILDCSSDLAKGQCYGLSQWSTGWISYWHNNNCLGKTSLPHEFVHWSRGWLMYPNDIDPPDGDHNDPIWFSDLNSLEMTLKINACFRCVNENLP